MPVVSIPTSFNIDLHFEVPGFLRRFAALLIDMVVQYVYLIAVFKLLGDFFTRIKYGHVDSINIYAIVLLALCPVFLYHIISELLMNGQSLGKKVMGLRVVSINGGRPSLSQFLIRWLLRVSDTWIVMILVMLITLSTSRGSGLEAWMIFIFGFGFLVTDLILIISTKKAQRVGDVLAHTIIIKTHSKAAIEETLFQEVENNYKPLFPQVMRISDRDLNVVNRILQQSRNNNNYVEAERAAQAIKSYLNIQTDMSPYDFLQTLMKDYNYLSGK